MDWIQPTFYTCFMLVALLGIFVFWRIRLIFTSGRVNVKKGRYAQLQEEFQKRFDDKALTRALSESGIPLSSVQYQLLRYTILSVWLLSSIVSTSVKGGEISGTLIQIMFVFLLTSPTPYLFKQRTLFKIVLDLLTERYKYKKSLEVYRAISQLKNLIIVKQRNPPGSTYILEQLNKFTKITRPIFNRMLSFWYVGQYEEAKNYFVMAMNTDNAEEIANLFLKLDGLNPIELKNQLILFQEDFKQKRQTEKLKLNQTRSYFIYGIVVLSLLMVLINFLVVTFLLDMMNNFKTIF